MFDYPFDAAAILQELGIQESEPEFQQEVLIKIRTNVDQRVGWRVQDELSDEDLETFGKLADKSDDEAKTWLKNRIPNIEDMFQEELARFVAELKRTLDTVV